MVAFAKLFESVSYGQILVMKQYRDNGMTVSILTQPPGLRVCNITVMFDDTDEGCASAEKFFCAIELADAERTAAEIWRVL